MSGETSKTEEKVSHSSEASTTEESGSGILGSIKKILLLAILLSASVLLGFMALRKQG